MVGGGPAAHGLTTRPPPPRTSLPTIRATNAHKKVQAPPTLLVQRLAPTNHTPTHTTPTRHRRRRLRG